MRKSLALITLLFVLISLLSACSAPPAPLAPGLKAIDPPIVLQDFTLNNQSNVPMHLADFKGKLALVTFGYTHCPDVCPINLAKFKQIKVALNDAAAKVNFVFVSVDGGRDTPAILGQHLALFDPEFIGLTGDDASTKVLTKQFGVEYTLNKTSPNQQDYTVTHTASSFLVDQQGRLQRIYSYDAKYDAIVSDVQQMLKSNG